MHLDQGMHWLMPPDSCAFLSHFAFTSVRKIMLSSLIDSCPAYLLLLNLEPSLKVSFIIYLLQNLLQMFNENFEVAKINNKIKAPTLSTWSYFSSVTIFDLLHAFLPNL